MGTGWHFVSHTLYWSLALPGSHILPTLETEGRDSPCAPLQQGPTFDVLMGPLLTWQQRCWDLCRFALLETMPALIHSVLCLPSHAGIAGESCAAHQSQVLRRWVTGRPKK